MKRLLPFVFAMPLLLCAPPSVAFAQNADADPIIEVAADDPVMEAAIAEAQRTLPEFLAVLGDPPVGAGDFAIKYPLGGWEHIWVDELALDGDRITGRLANAPEQEGHRIGEQVTVPLSEISDWGWRDSDGVMQGHRTTRVLLPRLSSEEAAAVRDYLGWE